MRVPTPLTRTRGVAPWPHALQDIATERRRQMKSEGWTAQHDDEHSQGEMAAAAGCYALAGSLSKANLEGSIRGDHPLNRSNPEVASAVEKFWPWDWSWWKPTDRRRNLVKAGALIVAEIERLDRAAVNSTPK